MTIISKHTSTPNQGNKQVSLLETTGGYSTTNVGGYGALQIPLGQREIADINSSNYSILTSNGGLTYEGSLTPTIVGELVSEEYNSSEAQSIANQNTATLDLLDNIDYVDGVYKSVYYSWFLSGGGVISNEDNNIITVDFIDDFIGAKFLLIIDYDGLGTNVIVEILEIIDNTSIRINIDIQLQSDHNYAVAYESTSYFANTYNINKCLHSKIANLAASCGCNDDYVSTLFQAVMLYMSIQPNMDLGKYTQAQETINALTMFCNDGSCNC